MYVKASERALLNIHHYRYKFQRSRNHSAKPSVCGYLNPIIQKSEPWAEMAHDLCVKRCVRRCSISIETIRNTALGGFSQLFVGFKPILLIALALLDRVHPFILVASDQNNPWSILLLIGVDSKCGIDLLAEQRKPITPRRVEIFLCITKDSLNRKAAHLEDDLKVIRIQLFW